jgi:hypothetical protein
MILAASCTGGYVLFHSQRRELAALHAEDNKTAASAGTSAATSVGAGATSGVDSATSGGARARAGAGQESGESKS